MSYSISTDVAQKMATLTGLPEVLESLAFLEQDHPQAVEDQLEMVVIKSPTFQEQQRAAHFAAKLKELQLQDVSIDQRGNVIGFKKGQGRGPAILIEAHLDTVFPMEVEIAPRIVEGVIHAPGICDCTRGLAALLSLLRALNHSSIPHSGDIYIVGTTCEEGMGGLRGMKGFFADHPGLIAASITIDGAGADRLVYNATGIKTMVFSFTGIGGHASGAFAKVANPLHAAARAVAAIANLRVPEDPRTTFAVSNFHSGNDAGIHAIP